MTDLLVVLSHPDTLASGRPIAPGDHVAPDALNPKDMHDARLIIDGAFVAAPSEPVDYDKLELDDLQTRADGRHVKVTGTGSGGRVLKKDLVDALKAADAEPADQGIDPQLVETAAATLRTVDELAAGVAVAQTAADAEAWLTDPDNPDAVEGAAAEEAK